MGIYIRKVKHKDGSVREVWYGIVHEDTKQFYPSGRKKYRKHKESLGHVSDISKKEAEKQFKKFEHYIFHERAKDTKPDPTLNKFTPEYISYVRDVIGKRSWNRDVIILKHMAVMFGSLRLSQITPNDIINYQEKRLAEGKANSTVNRELACLRHLYSVAKNKQKYSGDNPVSRVRFLEVNNEIERILTQEEEKRLMAASPQSLRDILSCALNTGMRRGEILSLTWNNVDLKNNYLFIESARTKTKRIRRVPINSTLKKLLINLKAQDSNTEYVFLTSRGLPYKKSKGVQDAFTYACRRAGINNLRFHDLRHTVATRLVEAGVDIFRVASILGHRDVRMTQLRYAHPDQSLKTDIELLSGNNHPINHPIKNGESV